MAQKSNEIIDLAGIGIEVKRRGSGAPLVLFHDEEALTPESPVVEALAAGHEVIIPSPPGFGKSDRPDWLENIDDLSYIMLDFLDHEGINEASVIGFGLGGWLAAEIATKTCAHIARLVLVDPLGIKVGGPFDRDIQDIWYLPADKVRELKYADPKNGEIDYTQMPDEALEIVARNRETLARLCWQPYMHNPKLKKRLHRITAPTLVVWGAKDGIVTTDYGKAFAAEISGARFEVIDNAGHYPHLEQPDAFLKTLNGFLADAQAAA
jgi:pimeloyl-ACP methyl ester carboxylesterase